MKSVIGKIAAPFILASFLLVVFFSFAMSYGSVGGMQGGCPFSSTDGGASSCPASATAMAIHHINAYQSFLSAPANFGVDILLLTLSSIGLALTFFAKPILRILLAQQKGVLYESPPSAAHNKKLSRWLSLFENSPSFT